MGVVKQIDGLIASTTTSTPVTDAESKTSNDREKTPAGLAVKAADAVIIYQRSGGLAGVNDPQWYITASGNIVDNKGSQKSVRGGPSHLVAGRIQSCWIL